MNRIKIKKLVTFLIALLILGINASTSILAINNNESNVNMFKTKKLTLSYSKPKITDQGDSLKITVNEANQYYTQFGNPIIPYSSIVETFPLGTKIHDVVFTHSKPISINNSKPIITAQQPQFLDRISYEKQDELIEIFSSQEKINNNKWFEYKLGGGLNDDEHVTFLSIHVFPIYYDENYKSIQYIEKAEIKIIYETPKSIIGNEDIYDLVIISPSGFSNPINRLVDHKNDNDIKSIHVSLDEIYSSEYFENHGYDKQEQIKYFIKNAVEEWGIKYVLLVGSNQKVPIRKAWHGNYELLTDQYYADLYCSNGSFCSWDSNGNNFYGEYWHEDGKDFVDLYADVLVGRCACQNVFEVAILVDKIIKYETKTHGEWWEKIILLGGDTFPGYGIIEGELTNDKIAEALPDFTHIKIRTSEGTFNPKIINREVNKGARFVEYSGHGFEFGMATSPPDVEDRIFYYTYNLLRLSNHYKLPVVFFDACLTAKLDYSLGDMFFPFGLLKIPFPCYAWYWVKKIGGGAIATIGATEVAYSSVDEDGPQCGAGYLSLEFFKSFHSCDSVGAMLVSSQNNYLNNLWKDHWTIEQFILLGDSTLMVGGDIE